MYTRLARALFWAATTHRVGDDRLMDHVLSADLTPASSASLEGHPGQRRHWGDLSPTQRRVIIAAGVVQVALAAAAWTDLARRPASRVRGPKAAWAAAIAVNFVGPISYFAWGRRPTHPDQVG